MQIHGRRLLWRERDFLTHSTAIAWQVGHHIIGAKRQVPEVELALAVGQSKAQDTLFVGVKQQDAHVSEAFGAILIGIAFAQPRLAIEIAGLERCLGQLEDAVDAPFAPVETRLTCQQLDVHIVDVAVHLNHIRLAPLPFAQVIASASFHIQRIGEGIEDIGVGQQGHKTEGSFGIRDRAVEA